MDSKLGRSCSKAASFSQAGVRRQRSDPPVAGQGHDSSQYRWPEPALRECAWRKIRQKIADELNLPTSEEFMQQKAGSLF